MEQGGLFAGRVLEQKGVVLDVGLMMVEGRVASRQSWVALWCLA